MRGKYVPTPDEYYVRGYRAAIRAQPDCRAHYNDPWKSAYARGYDDGMKWRKENGIDFWAAKALVAVEVAAKPNGE